MLDGKGDGKIQVGYSTVQERHEIGDKWVDADGIPWEQKDGYKVKGEEIMTKNIVKTEDFSEIMHGEDFKEFTKRYFD